MKADKIKALRIDLNLNQQEFADLIGVSKRTVANYESGDSEPNHRTMAMIEKIYMRSEEAKKSNVGVLQYMEMQKNAIIHPLGISINDPSEVFRTKSGNVVEELPSGKFLLSVPMVPVRAQATYLSEHTDADFISELTRVSFIVDRVVQGSYRAFEIQNDSMNDGTINAIPDGAVVLGRELGKQHWTSPLRTNQFPYWIIVHKDTVMCKEIVDHDTEKGIIKCHSLNSSPEYQDFEVSLNDVHQLFNIIKKQL